MPLTHMSTACRECGEGTQSANAVNLLYFSRDGGMTWENPVETPLMGIVPDKLLELESGRWILAAHHHENGWLAQFMRYSDDQGRIMITHRFKQGGKGWVGSWTQNFFAALIDETSLARSRPPQRRVVEIQII